jgi:NAD kinase
MKCPKCKSKNIRTPRCMNCESTCINCGYTGEMNMVTELDYFYIDKYDREKYIDANNDIIIVKGGDGTLLKAINKYRHLNKPFFGIAAGTENFLMNDSKNTDIFDNAKYKEFTLIKVYVTFKKPDILGELQTVTEEYQAFNEVLMGGDLNTWAHFDVHDKDSIIGKFSGGGICISTAQGSTGFNMGNGGSVFPLGSKQWSVTSVVSKRNINIPIKSKRTSITVDSRTPITVWIDGQNKIIQRVEKIEIMKGDKVTVIFNDYKEFKKKRRV